MNYAISRPLDVNGDGELEIPFISIENRKIFFELKNFQGGGVVIHRTELEGLSLKLPGDRLSQMIVDIDDMDGDGSKEVTWKISGEFLGLPRGYVCHDIYTGKKKWEFFSGAIPYRHRTMDIDKDGKKELIFTLKAPHNGITYNGMNDDTSYVGILYSSGELRWIKEAGGFYSDIYFDVGDINGDGKFELVTSRSCHRAADPDPGEIKIYDLVSGAVLNSFTSVEGSFSQLYLADVADAPGSEIIVGDSAGFIRILDNNLRIVKKIKTDSAVSVLGVDVFTPGVQLIFAMERSSMFHIFNHKLKKVCSFKTLQQGGFKKPIIPVSNGAEKFFILNADRSYLIWKNKPGFSKYRVLIFSNFTLFLFFIFSFNLLVIMFLKERKARKRISIEQTVLPVSGTWIDMATDLTHRIKNTLTNVLLKSKSLMSAIKEVEARQSLPPELLETPEAMLADINELKLMNRFLMRLLQPQKLQLRNVKLNELVSGVIKKYSRFLKDRIDFIQQIDFRLPILQLDEERFNEALSNIIENAIEVLPKGGKIEIKAGFAAKEDQNQKGVLIQVSDNGPGIPENRIKEIFKPYYTTKKEGSGVGLSIARKYIEAHSGHITVESSVGVGTKFAIYIPIKVPG
ncbi:MAG: hypothetical protein KAW12_21470 [Candidatus Aminicenantes bacterium]|nr:hypothetical protein [Candidatus Aminicenantes bacterium]